MRKPLSKAKYVRRLLLICCVLQLIAMALALLHPLFGPYVAVPVVGVGFGVLGLLYEARNELGTH